MWSVYGNAKGNLMPILINSSNRPQAMQNAPPASPQAGVETARKTGEGVPVRDSAAMLAITHRISTQIRGINQALSQSNDAISMIQVAEQAMGEVDQRQQALTDLTRRASAPNLDSATRATLQQEAQQLHGELSALVEETEYNDTRLLSSGATLEVKSGTGENDQRTLTFPNLGKSFSAPDFTSAQSAQAQLPGLEQGAQQLVASRAALSGHHDALAQNLKDLTATAKSLTTAEARATDTSLAEGIATRVSSFLRQPSDGTLQNSLPNPNTNAFSLLQG